MTFAMLVVLLGLGTWQIYRLHWKQGVLARIAAAESEPPVLLGTNPAPYTKVSVSGQFRFDRAVQFGVEVRDMAAGPMLGSYQIVPLEREHASAILVNRGWIPQKRNLPLDDPAGPVTVTGYIRQAESASWFSATDDPAARQFFTLDPARIGAVVGESDLAPFTLIALALNRANVYPVAAEHLPRPPNNHLSYVITWYGLAAALAVIFGVWFRRALQS